MVHGIIFLILGILSLEILASTLNLEVTFKGVQNSFPKKTPSGRDMWYSMEDSRSSQGIGMVLLIY